MKANSDIRETASMCGVKQWEIAEALGKSESWLSTKMRKELPEELRMRIFMIISRIEKEHENGLP